MNSPYRVGIDIGGVIISQDTDNPDLFFTKSFLDAEPFPDSFETIKNLIIRFGRENVFIISKCGLLIQEKSKKWLTHKDFFSLTNFDSNNIHFCLERHEKANIATNLNLDIFIDDRYTVLKHMIALEHMKQLILFCPNDYEKELSSKNPNSKMKEVSNWKEIRKLLNLN